MTTLSTSRLNSIRETINGNVRKLNKNIQHLQGLLSSQKRREPKIAEGFMSVKKLMSATANDMLAEDLYEILKTKEGTNFTAGYGEEVELQWMEPRSEQDYAEEEARIKRLWEQWSTMYIATKAELHKQAELYETEKRDLLAIEAQIAAAKELE